MKKSADNKLNQALSYHQSGNYDEAGLLYRKILKKDKSNIQVLYLLGTLLVQAGKIDEGIKSLKSVVNIRSDYIEALNSLGIAFQEKNDVESAEEYFKKALEIKPDYSDGLANIAFLYAKKTEFEKAIHYFEILVKLKPNDSSPLLNIANCYFVLKEYRRAELYYKEAIKLNPTAANFYHRLGLTLYNQSNYQESAAIFLNALKLDQANSEGYYFHGCSSLFVNDFDSMKYSFLKALALNQNYESSIYQLACDLITERKFQLSNILFQFLQQKNIGFLDYSYYLAFTYKCLGKWDICKQTLAKLWQSKSPNEKELCLLGEVCLQEKLWLEAINLYGRAININPQYAEAYNGLGVARLQHGGGRNNQMARLAFEKAIDLCPNNFDPNNNLGFMLKGINTEKAIDLLKIAVSIDKSNSEAHLNLAYSLLAIGDELNGWEEYQWRWGTSNQKKRSFEFREWRGNEEELVGKTILIYSEQGLGDVILFASCISWLLEKSHICVIECEQRLVSLFERSFTSALVLTEDEIYKRCDGLGIDLQVAIGSLPKFTREYRRNSRPEAYLQIDAKSKKCWEDKLQKTSKKLYVGFSWKSGLTGLARQRYFSLKEWEYFLSSDYIQLVNLQYDAAEIELEEIDRLSQQKIMNFSELDLKNDLDQLSALIAALGLVVSHPNAVSALAGAVGTEVWRVNLPQAKEAFCLNQADYPWYPKVVTFRHHTDSKLLLCTELHRKYLFAMEENKSILKEEREKLYREHEFEADYVHRMYECVELFRRRSSYEKAEAMLSEIEKEEGATSIINLLRARIYFDKKDFVKLSKVLPQLEIDETSFSEVQFFKYFLMIESDVLTNEQLDTAVANIEKTDDTGLWGNILKQRYLVSLFSNGEFIEIIQSKELTLLSEKINPYYFRLLGLAYFYNNNSSKAWFHYRSAYRNYEAYKHNSSEITFDYLCGKAILVYGYASITEEILIASFLKEVSKKIKNMTIEVDKRLFELFTQNFPFLNVLTRDRAYIRLTEEKPSNEYEYEIEFTKMAELLNVGGDNHCLSRPYLKSLNRYTPDYLGWKKNNDVGKFRTLVYWSHDDVQEIDEREHNILLKILKYMPDNLSISFICDDPKLAKIKGLKNMYFGSFEKTVFSSADQRNRLSLADYDSSFDIYSTVFSDFDMVVSFEENNIDEQAYLLAAGQGVETWVIENEISKYSISRALLWFDCLYYINLDTSETDIKTKLKKIGAI